MCVFELLTTGLCYLTANTSGLGFVLWEIITERVNTSTCFIPGFKCRNKHSFSDGFRHRDLGKSVNVATEGPINIKQYRLSQCDRRTAYYMRPNNSYVGVCLWRVVWCG